MSREIPAARKPKDPTGVFKRISEAGISFLKSADIRDHEEEGHAAIRAIADILFLQDKIAEFKRTGKPSAETSAAVYRSITESNFLVTHLLLTHGDDEDFLAEFWKAAGRLAADLDKSISIEHLRKGIVTQAAVFHILELLGKEPKLSHPEEDAFYAIDLWAGADEVIQVKGGPKPGVYGTDYMAPASVETVGKDGTTSTFASDSLFQYKLSQFFIKAKAYARRKKKKLKAYALTVPYEQVSMNSGRPKPALVEFFKKEFAALDQNT